MNDILKGIIGYVARPKPEVFDITKRKLHNVLQGIAPIAVTGLTEEEKQAYLDWSAENVDRYWLDDDGPIKNSDIIIVDDPQGESRRQPKKRTMTLIVAVFSDRHYSPH